MNIQDTISAFALGLYTVATGGTPPSPMDVTQWDVKTWIAVAGVVTSGVMTYLAFRKGKSDEVTASTDVKVKLDQLIDARVERNLKSAWDEIDQLKEQVKALQGAHEENTQIKDIVKRHFVRLLDWDSRGRRGNMPLPDIADVELLGLEHPIMDTLTRQQRDDLVSDGR